MFIKSYDTASKHCFVGDSNGNITFLKLSESGCEFKATLNGHEGKLLKLFFNSVYILNYLNKI